MSSVYTLEPNTEGRAILHTSHGPLELHLWSSQMPATCRNFLQHALDGTYDGLPFHRVIPGVLVQTGDPTRTGTGGHAASTPTRREAHARLRFRRRALCAMVADDDGEVRSQFFITLAPTDWLDGQHSIFGYVAGDTVFNLLGMDALGEMDGFDCEGAPSVTRVELLENPFEGMVARVRETSQPVQPKASTGAKRATRNRKLLSFGNGSGSESEGDASGMKAAPERRRLLRPTSDGASGDVCVSAARLSSEGVTSSEALRTPVGRADATGARDGGTVQGGKDNASIVQSATAEFERLKAAMLGGAAGRAGGAGAAGGEGKTSRAVALGNAGDRGTPDAGQTAQEGDTSGVEQRETVVAPVTGAVGKRVRDETETLRRLRAFEERLVRARRGDGDEGDGSAWFSGGFQVSAESDEEEQRKQEEEDDEYVVLFSHPDSSVGVGGGVEGVARESIGIREPTGDTESPVRTSVQ